MTKFHLTASGPRVCEAEKRACPIGGEHYTDRESAEAAFLREGAFMAVPSPHTRLATLPSLEHTGYVTFMAGYQGVKVPEAVLAPMLEAWRETHGMRALELEERLNEARGSERHLTVVDPREQRKHREIRSPQEPISFTAAGIGAVERDGEEAWFIVCSSLQVQEFRARYGLPPKDLHITIGFSSKDIHGVAKVASTLRYI